MLQRIEYTRSYLMLNAPAYLSCARSQLPPCPLLQDLPRTVIAILARQPAFLRRNNSLNCATSRSSASYGVQYILPLASDNQQARPQRPQQLQTVLRAPLAANAKHTYQNSSSYTIKHVCCTPEQQQHLFGAAPAEDPTPLQKQRCCQHR